MTLKSGKNDSNNITKFVFLRNKAFYPTIGTRRLFRRDKTPMAVSCLILRLN